MYDTSYRHLVSWVRIPVLSCSVDTVFYMCVGNSTITESTENVSGVWAYGYTGVWHLNEGVSGTGTLDVYKDSASTHHGDDYISGTGQSGITGPGLELDGVSDYIDCGNIGIESGATISCWVYLNDITISDYLRGIAVKGSFGNDTAGDMYVSLACYDGSWHQTGNGRLYFGVHMEAAPLRIADTIPAPLDTWIYFAGTFDGTTSHVYSYSEAGNYVTSNTGTEQTFTDNSHSFHIGAFPGNTSDSGINGIIDEVRISSLVRPEGWIKTSYNNMSNPSAFYSVTD
jgi:hypothetical protein